MINWLEDVIITLLLFQVGDSVVSKGRETLERAIQFIESNARPEPPLPPSTSSSPNSDGWETVETELLLLSKLKSHVLDKRSPLVLVLYSLLISCIARTKQSSAKAFSCFHLYSYNVLFEFTSYSVWFSTISKIVVKCIYFPSNKLPSGNTSLN